MQTLACLTIATFVVASLAGCADRSGAPRTWGRPPPSRGRVDDDLAVDEYREAAS